MFAICCIYCIYLFSFLQILGSEDLQEPTTLAPHRLNLLHVILRERQGIPTRILNVNV